MKKVGKNPLRAISKFIVDKRMLFYIVFLAAFILGAVYMSKVKINYDITSYLPPESETKIALDIMDREFEEFTTARVMLTNVTYENAAAVADRIGEVAGVDTVSFTDSEASYKQSSALISLTMKTGISEDTKDAAFASIRSIISEYDSATSGMGSGLTNTLQKEMTVILLIAVAVIVLVLIFTSKSFMEIPVFLIIFGVAAVLNMGSNFLLGEISFVTNSIAVILQLALAIDYAIILTHRFMEERETKNPREAMISALSKAIPEIFSSSLTTVSGLVALMLMQLRLGYDMGMVLAKGVIISCLTVFLLMPGLVLLFSKSIEKTRHRSFVPKITAFGKAVVKSRYVLASLFLCVLVGASVLQSFNNYSFSYEATPVKEARLEIEKVFGKSNALGVIVKKGDYEQQRQIIDTFMKYELVDSATGLASVEINGTGLVDKLTPKEFSDFSGVELTTVKNVYLAYGLANGHYWVINNVDNFSVTLIDLVDFLHEITSTGLIQLDPGTQGQIDGYYEQLSKGRDLLEGENYARILFNITGDSGSKETFDLVKTLRADLKEIEADAYIFGDSVSAYDLSQSFNADLTKINLLTVAFILIILLFTFKSVGIPIILILTIQGSVWVNFSIPVIVGQPLFFMSYLIISAIQMGATIDYAIVITNRYLAEKQLTDNKTAIVNTLNAAFPTVFTSGSILTVAGFLVGYISTDPIISSIGQYLGQGTLISLISVMVVLPQLLLLTDRFISKTSLAAVSVTDRKLTDFSGRVSGRVKGYLSGYVDAEMQGTVKGDLDASVETISPTNPETPPSDTAQSTPADTAGKEA